MTNTLIAMPIAAWPAQDRALWESCCGQPLDLDSTPLASRRPSTRHLLARAYGEWLQWRANSGLPNDGDPGSRLSASDMLSYAKAQRQRGLATSTIARSLQSLITVIASLSPTTDVTDVRKIANRAKKQARREHRAIGSIVQAGEMYQLGFDLLTAGRDRPGNYDDLFVDGLVIALLTACPLRIGDFALARLDHHIVRDRYRWRLLVKASKTSKADYCSLPDELTSFIDLYTEVIRPRLILRSYAEATATDRFFIGTSGLPLNSQVMRRRIKAVTAEAFGEPVLPHSFRKMAVSTLVNEEPEHAASAPSLLDHADPRITEDHYLIGQQILARQRYQAMLDRMQRRRP